MLYRSECGEAGCGNVVARCYRMEDEAVWDRFDAGNPRQPDLQAPLRHGDSVVFDAEHYESVMHRVQEIAEQHSVLAAVPLVRGPAEATGPQSSDPSMKYVVAVCNGLRRLSAPIG